MPGSPRSILSRVYGALTLRDGRLRRRHATLVDELRHLASVARFGHDDGGTPWIAVEEAGVKLYGFATAGDQRDRFDLLRPVLPPEISEPYFRLATDWVTRWVYPHMRPDLKPPGDAVPLGFHGQHKDTIHDLPDADARGRLLIAFRPREGEVIIDGGSFLGFGALRWAMAHAPGRILAVEASSACHALLQRNVAENGMAGVVVPLHRGLWKGPGEIDLATGQAQANSLIGDVVTSGTHETVQTASIDALVGEHDLKRVDFISLTLNGAEVEAIEGAAETLTRFRPRLRLAGWYRRDGRPVADLAAERLVPLGYEVFIGPRGNVLALPQ